jgi:hypothetical protein
MGVVSKDRLVFRCHRKRLLVQAQRVTVFAFASHQRRFIGKLAASSAFNPALPGGGH